MSKLVVDKSYCISLSGREDRRAILADEWARLDMAPDYFLCEKDIDNPVRGCFESHVAAAADAQARGLQRILVLEDDFKFLPFDDRQFDEVNRFLGSAAMNDIDIFYLGHFPKRVHLSEYPGIAYIQGNGAHAYILERRGIEKIAALTFSGVPIDTYYKANLKAMAAFPMLCIQQLGSTVCSDIAASGSQEVDDGWARRIRKQFRQAYLNNIHKSIWYVAKGFVQRLVVSPAAVNKKL